MFVQHLLIKEETIEDRDYQRNLAAVALRSSTLVVLPTGMGKTVVALMVMAEVLREKGGKILLLAPTKPLVEQHACFLKDHLVGRSVTVLTGEVEPEERELLWIQNHVIVSTPQVVANDLRSGRVSLREVNLIIFDEAHRAVGNYAYVKVAEEYAPYGRLVMGMTASPGSSKEKIDEVCENLGIERLEIRTERDPDVAKYLQDINIHWVEVEVPGRMRKIGDMLQSMYDAYLKELINLGVMDRRRQVSKRYLLEIGSLVQARVRSGERRKQLYRAMSVQAMALKVGHALELVETQGMTALKAYLSRLEEEAESDDGSKAARSIVKSKEFKRVKDLCQETDMEHPKISRVVSIVSNQLMARPESRVIVFTNYRDTCELVASRLSSIPEASVGKLIGQSERQGDRGLKQKEQVALLDKFRGGELNVVVATSVGEEGLDIATTDLVVFYEPIPSEIRTIQRRGRTGRRSPGRVVILLARGTRDETHYWSAMRKEKAMRSRLISLREEAEEQAKEGQRTLSEY